MSDAQPERQPSVMRARILVAGAIVSAGIAATVSCAELLQKHGVLIGSQQIPPAALAFFFLMITVYRLNGWFRYHVSPHELLAIYCMALVAALVASRGIVETVLPMLVSAGYFADDANKWQSLFFPHLRQWLVAFDPDGPSRQSVARHYFEGLRPGACVSISLDSMTISRTVWTCRKCLASCLTGNIRDVSDHPGTSLMIGKGRAGAQFRLVVSVCRNVHASFDDRPSAEVSGGQPCDLTTHYACAVYCSSVRCLYRQLRS